ncbi:PAS factor family protein [Photobacterium sp. DNB23_23_1]|uniref:PAS factor family protein n=1 Tax=Photobacterium pectinilyticum TaxID=2906793 RepID=A0ABT1N537_9GAMM|nr:PAS factor family protein [Photobacterium sp. ZSDE20]MCQ1059672.1 PAS factor family protein [Photobacterium sp. ZSDE20]MDD1825814.1 PAS factor family protein [Photobacterium sp. ZSDE20]
MDNVATLIYDTSMRLTAQNPEHHAEIRQGLYEQLGLPFCKQLALYTNVLGPASSGKLECSNQIKKAVDLALKELF